jgi:sterol desaturase/sphingolipid hydroxylase (fatty acid hydroxylase superfamily)
MVHSLRVAQVRPNETEDERADRNFGDLLQELRVAQTGVQILFGFLLTIPLQARYTSLDGFHRNLLVAAVLLLAVATAFIIAPVAWHRALFRQQMKDEVVRVANRLAQVGLAALALGIVTSIVLMLDLVISRGWALIAGGTIFTLLLMLWLVAPLSRRAGRRDR